MKYKKLLVIAGVITAIGIAGFSGMRYISNKSAGKTAQAKYMTQTADLGSITRIVSASGPLNPVNQVQVGTQVSGTIKAIHADFNAPVKVGQLLAEIDPATLDAELSQANALLRSALASRDQANTRLARNRDLFEKGFISRAEVDDAQSTVKTAQAAVDQQTAAVSRSATSRRNALIRSPVAGIVTAREVSVGQTVAASFNTPVLFRIAQDLREMQIEANVSEADIGSMKEAQTVEFTVDAFPGRSFSGAVFQIRNNYTVQQNVVTYTVVIRARNDTLELRPGMTGYVRVTVGERAQVVKIPNAALRYEPPRAPGEKAAAAAQSAPQKTVWRLTPDGAAQPVELTLGLTDGKFTEM
ncbi:MAG: Multidrug resistance protein MdtA, partial [Pseudomonadota bacterium]